MTPALDPTAPGWGHLAERVAEIQARRMDVGLAADIVAAAICDDCGDGRPVVDPERGIGHVVERGRRGPGDPDTVDSWAACEAEGLWQALRRAHAVELRVLAEPDYEGRAEPC